MPAVYLCDVAPNETHPWRVPIPVLPASFGTPGNRQYTLMFRYNPVTEQGKAVIICTLTNLTGPGLNKLVEGPTVETMRTNGRSGTGLNAARRNAINTWLTNQQMTPVPGSVTTWGDLINHVVRQDSPGFDIFGLEF